MFIVELSTGVKYWKGTNYSLIGNWLSKSNPQMRYHVAFMKHDIYLSVLLRKMSQYIKFKWQDLKKSKV